MNWIAPLAFVVFVVYLIVRNFRKMMKGDDLSILPRVEAEFRQSTLANTLPERCFDSRTAEIVHERREGMTDSETQVYTLHRVERFARNAQGEYFHFISEGAGTPYIKHISQVNAKAVLGKKYKAAGT